MSKLIVPILAAVAAMGCSSGTRTVSGQLDLTQMRPINAQVVAISSTGRVFRAPIAANGAFSISLPTQASYTMRFANATNVAGRYDAFATLAPRRAGATTHWFTLTSGAAIKLGNVARPGTSAAHTTGGLTTASDGADDSAGQDGAGDTGEHEDDGAEACDLSGGADNADVESDHDVNDDVDSDHDGTPDSADDHDDRATCATKSGDGCKLSDDESKELDDDADKSCTTGGTTGTPAPAPAPGLAP